MMTRLRENYFILTGGPGSGKTTLIDALEKTGMTCVGEDGRTIIQTQLSISGLALPWSDRRIYRELMLSHAIHHYLDFENVPGPALFDRGIPDVLAYSRLVGLGDEGHLQNATRIYRYNPIVLIAPPWKEIYVNDAERKQNFGEAIATFEALNNCYQSNHYTLIELPCDTVERRVDFVLQIIESRQRRSLS